MWKAPYVAFHTFEEFITSAADISDGATLREALETIRAASTRSELRTALVALDLIDSEGAPTLQFRRFARQPEARQAVLKDLLDRYYAAARSVAASGAEREQIAASFDPPISLAKTGARAVAFLVAMVEAAGEAAPAEAAALTAAGPAEDRYGEALESAIERMSQSDLTDEANWERFNFLCDRYEKWKRRKV